MTREEAIAKIKEWNFLNKDEKEILETIIPELAENEDERIRKEIIEYFVKQTKIQNLYGACEDSDENVAASKKKNKEFQTWIAWIEKQGELKLNKEFTFKALPRLLDMIKSSDKAKVYCQKLIDSLENEGYSVDAKIVKEHLKIMNGEEVAIATMDEQKPKFKSGDWITNGEYTWYVEGSHNGFYDIVSFEGCKTDDTISHVDEHFRLWTIADAKDGDVLVDRFSTNSIIILFKGINLNSSILVYCGYNGYIFSVKTDGLGYGRIDNTNYHPATKEQRDLLFQKMKESGYEWDTEKKELKKIEYKPKFKDGDWVIGKQGNVHQIERVVENVTNHTFGYDLVGGGYFNDSAEGVRLWTIADAKKGDVLASKDKLHILIFRNLDTSTSFSSYYNIAGKGELGWSNDCFIPATKEQRELLFSKMEEAGYEWDDKKKKLKISDFSKHLKVDDPVSINSSEWSEVDETIRKALIELVKYSKKNCFYLLNQTFNNVSMDTMLDWLEKQEYKLPAGFYYVNSKGEKFYSDSFKYGDVVLHIEKQEKPK